MANAISTLALSSTEFDCAAPTGFGELDGAPTNDLAVDLKLVTGLVGGGGSLSGSLPNVLGGYFSGEYIGSLGGEFSVLAGELFLSNQLVGELPKLSGQLYASSRVLGEFPAVLGKLSIKQGTTGFLSGTLPCISGVFTGRNDQRFLSLAGRLHNLVGDVRGSSEALCHLGGILHYQVGALTGITGSVSSLTGNFTNVSGNLVGVSGATSCLEGSIPSVNGTLQGMIGNVVYCSGNLPTLIGSFDASNFTDAVVISSYIIQYRRDKCQI